MLGKGFSSSRVIDNWNVLPLTVMMRHLDGCINCSTINTIDTFRKHLSSELESEAVKLIMFQL